MRDRLCVIDLETTGLSPEFDEIIEFGAARLEGTEITGRFARLARPARPLPREIAELTGLRPEELAAAPPLAAALDAFLDFIGDDPCLAHNADFEAGFLARAAGGRFASELFDSLELARILLPELPSHALDRLRRELKLPDSPHHRALGDAEATAALWLRLMDELARLPPPVLHELGWLLAPLKSPLRELFGEAENVALIEALRGGGKSGEGDGGARGEGEQSAYAALLPDFSKLIGYRAPEEAGRDLEREPLPCAPVGETEVAEVFAAGGPLAKRLGEYESRPQQVELARAVAAALAAGRHLIAEAGTGVGKSLAYLVPALLHATRNRERVVVSTHTKNLQAQLVEKDLPLLAGALGVEFRAALIKGRTNYLCPRRLLYLLREAPQELDPDERRALLPLVVWAARTASGDLADCTGFQAQPAARGLHDRLTSAAEDCLGRACRLSRSCFPRQARALAQAADLVVANHALVFTELAEPVALPPHQVLIFDEAQNLERVATEHLAVGISRWRVTRPLRRLSRKTRGGRWTGSLSVLAARLGFARMRDGGGAGGAGELFAAAERLAEQAAGAVSAVPEALEPFLEALGGLFARRATGATGAAGAAANGGEFRVRFQAAAKRPEVWGPIEQAKQGLLAALASLLRRLEQLGELLGELDAAGRRAAQLREPLQEVLAQVEPLRELIHDLEFVVRGDEPDYVYWAELHPGDAGGEGGDGKAGRRGRRRQAEPSYALSAAPIEISQLLHDQLYARKRSLVLTSATLTVDGKFDFLKQRLGLDLLAPGRLAELCVGTPYDYPRQCRVWTTSFLPDPGDARFEEAFSRMLVPLCTASRGRAMVLFTSYRALDRVAGLVREPLAQAGIALLVQGQDGPREKLLQLFREEPRAVLLGAASFWEGVDVRGEALSLLVLTKLPFAVHTDPIVQARCERIEARGEDAFLGYSVPTAVLTFRQGFGRLIRSRRDRGAVILTDRRLVAKRYGGIFLRSLPVGSRTATDPARLARETAAFLDAAGGVTGMPLAEAAPAYGAAEVSDDSDESDLSDPSDESESSREEER